MHTCLLRATERRARKDLDGGSWCRTSANFLPRRSQEDDILNVVTDAIVMVVFLMDNRALGGGGFDFVPVR